MKKKIPKPKYKIGDSVVTEKLILISLEQTLPISLVLLEVREGKFDQFWMYRLNDGSWYREKDILYKV